MKKTIIILGCVFISFASFGYTPMEISPQLEEFLDVGVYPVVATTDNGYMENYSIGAQVHATEYYGQYSISKVMVEGRSVSYRAVYGSDNKYSFSHGSYTYYFTF